MTEKFLEEIMPSKGYKHIVFSQEEFQIIVDWIGSIRSISGASQHQISSGRALAELVKEFGYDFGVRLKKEIESKREYRKKIEQMNNDK